MLDKLISRRAPLLTWAFQSPFGRFLVRPSLVRSYHPLVVLGSFFVLGLILLGAIFKGDYPPGVDSPTFLHLSWVTKTAASGNLSNPFQDPYWYDGFSYLVAYPPLGYGLVGVTSFVTRMDLGVTYGLLHLLGYAGVGATVYWFALGMGQSRWTAVLAGLLVALAYPLLAAVFLWGWFTSVLALPLALASFMFLQRSLESDRRAPAVWGGVLMSLAILVHHMTGLGIGLGMAGWFLYHAAFPQQPRRRLVLNSAIYCGVAFLIVAPWGIPFFIHSLDVGFRREIPGLWLPTLDAYRSNIVNDDHIGNFIYPSYLGTTLVILATAGTIFALIERRTLAGIAVALLVLIWFSMGAEYNPLIRTYPFSGLDVARFHLFMVPFMALMAAAMVARLVLLVKDLWANLPSRAWYPFVGIIGAVVLVFPAIDAVKARDAIEPYYVNRPVEQAMEWLTDLPADNDGTEIRIYPVELWHWQAFVLPLRTDHQLIDGWHDEGASNVTQIRELRLMCWTGLVDIDRASQIWNELNTTHVLIDSEPGCVGGASDLLIEEMAAQPLRFRQEAQWGDVVVFSLTGATGPIPPAPNFR